MTCCKRHCCHDRYGQSINRYVYLRIMAAVFQYLNGLFWLIITLVSNTEIKPAKSLTILNIHMDYYLQIIIVFSQILSGGIYMVSTCNVLEYNNEKEMGNLPFAIIGSFITGIMLGRAPMYITIFTGVMYMVCTAILVYTARASDYTHSRDTHSRDTHSRDTHSIDTHSIDTHSMDTGVVETHGEEESRVIKKTTHMTSIVTAEPIMGTCI